MNPKSTSVYGSGSQPVVKGPPVVLDRVPSGPQLHTYTWTHNVMWALKPSGIVWYSTVEYGTVQYSMVQHSMVQYGTVQYGTAQYSMAQYSTVQYSRVWHSTVWHSTVDHKRPHSSNFYFWVAIFEIG